MIILIHTSKTMRPSADEATPGLTKPLLLDRAIELQAYTQTLTVKDVEKTMHVSEKLAQTTRDLIQSWTVKPANQRAAVDSFLGDIYSGMQVGQWSDQDRSYAQDHLKILSGLYGVLRPLDGIFPYRLEMGYKFPDTAYKNLYKFWGDSILKTIPVKVLVVDLSAVEYGKTVTPYLDTSLVITPRFLTISPKTGEPTFVVVHAKIARGAFASWMIRNRIDDVESLKDFDEIGYAYNAELSTQKQPVFVCKEFGGIGLSVRLS